MLKQEHAVLAGEMARVEIEDAHLKKIEEELAAEAKRKKLQNGFSLKLLIKWNIEVIQECCPLIFHPELNAATIETILEMVGDIRLFLFL